MGRKEGSVVDQSRCILHRMWRWRHEFGSVSCHGFYVYGNSTTEIQQSVIEI